MIIKIVLDSSITHIPTIMIKFNDGQDIVN